VAIRLIPYAQSITREKFILSRFHPSESTASGISSTYCSNTVFSNSRYLSAFSPPSRNAGPKRVVPCTAHLTVIHVLVWWWASIATWLSYVQYTVLCPFTYPFKWKHTSSLNVISSARILCVLNCPQNWTGRSLSLHVILVEIYLVRLKFVTLHYAAYTFLRNCYWRCRLSCRSLWT
jgi:hypothetical protein